MIEDINQNDDAGIKNGSLCVQLQLISASYILYSLEWSKLQDLYTSPFGIIQEISFFSVEEESVNFWY